MLGHKVKGHADRHLDAHVLSFHSPSERAARSQTVLARRAGRDVGLE